jgi:protocatechuate 3,4-dioxygenase beta subunit
MVGFYQERMIIKTRKTGWSMSIRYILQGFLLILALFLPLPAALAGDCPTTQPDMLGPFYKPDAPVRSSVGKGYALSGVVKSSKDCSPVKNARIEFWLAAPDGDYDDAHRATLFADDSGRYRFESNVPVPYSGRPPHIHLRVSAKGFQTLVTQHYPEKGKNSSAADLVLIPAK